VKKRTQGLGLLEVLLTLVVSAVLIIVGINYYQNVSRAQKVNKTMQQLQALTTTMTDLASSAANSAIMSSGDITSVLSNKLPASTLQSPWIQQKINVFGVVTNSSCASFKVKICGIESSAQSTLTTQFHSVYANTNNSITFSSGCGTFQICIQ
jgi:type II secretory pathway pseudopilin PulG